MAFPKLRIETPIEELLKFPSDFFWGTAIAAHQNEGNNTKSNWWTWEETHRDFPKSGIACDHYNKFGEDFKLAKNVLHNNSFRFSIEWARVEPEEGVWNQSAIDHYKKVFEALKEMKLVPFVTLFHFTLPEWFCQKGGFEKSENVEYFTRFSRFVVGEFGEDAQFWMTINEPYSYVGGGYWQGMWPPGKKNFILGLKVYLNLIKAHKESYRAIKAIKPSLEVGIVIPMIDFHYHLRSKFASLFRSVLDWLVNKSFLSLTQESYDFIGLNYYITHDIQLRRDLSTEITKEKIEEAMLASNNSLDYFAYAAGIYEILASLKKHKKPIYITESGLADKDDHLRPRFLIGHLAWVYQAIKEGVDVRGYFHWTLMDNFEWAFGTVPKFGLFETDFKTLKRTPRKSAFIYGEICKTNCINQSILTEMIDSTQL